MSMNNGFYALSVFGRLYCIGNNDDGLIGTETAGAISELTEIVTTARFDQVASENAVATEDTSHRIALSKEGRLYTWGKNTNGCLGNNSFTGTVDKPTEISSETYWTDVFSGNNRQYAIRAGGALYACGNDDSHALGCGGAISNKSVLTATGITTGAVRVFGLAEGTAVLKSDGTLWVVGKNLFGMFGTGDAVDTVYSVFTQVGTDTDWALVGYNATSCLAVKDNGNLWGAGLQNTSYPLPDYASAGTHLSLFLLTSSELYIKSIFGRTAWSGFRYLTTVETKSYYFGDNVTDGEHFGTGAVESSPQGFMSHYSDGALISADDDGYVFVGHDCTQRVFGIKSDKTIWVWGDAPSGLGSGSSSDSVPKQETSGLDSWGSVSNQARSEMTPVVSMDGSNIALTISVDGMLSDELGRALTGAMVLPRLRANGVLSPGAQGSMELPIIIAQGEMASPFVLLGQSTLPALRAAGVITKSYGITGVMTVPMLRSAGTLSVSRELVATLALPALTNTGALSVAHSAIADMTLPCLVVSATILSEKAETILEYSDECNFSN